MTKIIVPVDCTLAAKSIAQAAKELAGKYEESKVILLHVFLQPDYYFTGQYLPILGFNENYHKNMDEMVEGNQLRNSVMRFMDNLKEHIKMPTAEIRVIDGVPAEVILEMTKNTEADLMVIGKQDNPKETKGIGSITLEVLKKVDIPTFVIPTSEGEINNQE